MFKVKETIKKRKSVRSFDGTPLKESDRTALEQFIENVPNPFNVPVEFKLLETKKDGVSSPVVVGEELYMAAKVARTKNYEIGYGYSFETACLYATSLGLGTVMLAASLSRSAFEKAMDLSDDEVMPVASPVGYPAAKRTVRDSLMRKGLKSDQRIAFEKIFFDGSFEKGLKKENAGVFKEALEMFRWAPSATNKQPWYAVIDNDVVHFYENKSLKDNALGDIQKVDMGIALAHFDLTLQEEGIQGHFIEADPQLVTPEKALYIISYERGQA